MGALFGLLTLPLAIGLIAGIAKLRGHDDGAATSDILVPLPVTWLWLRERLGGNMSMFLALLLFWGLFFLFGAVLLAVYDAVT